MDKLFGHTVPTENLFLYGKKYISSKISYVHFRKKVLLDRDAMNSGYVSCNQFIEWITITIMLNLFNDIKKNAADLVIRIATIKCG